LEAEIYIRYRSRRLAESIKEAIDADNVLNGRGMRISTHVHERGLTIIVKACRRIETLQATVHDIFRCIRAVEASLSKLQARGEA